MISKFKDILLQLPPNLNKSPIYRDKSIEEIPEMMPEKTCAPWTVNCSIVRIGSLFNYAVKNGDMQSNPATDLQVKIKKRPEASPPVYKSAPYSFVGQGVL